MNRDSLPLGQLDSNAFRMLVPVFSFALPDSCSVLFWWLSKWKVPTSQQSFIISFKVLIKEGQGQTEWGVWLLFCARWQSFLFRFKYIFCSCTTSGCLVPVLSVSPAAFVRHKLNIFYNLLSYGNQEFQLLYWPAVQKCKDFPWSFQLPRSTAFHLNSFLRP